MEKKILIHRNQPPIDEYQARMDRVRPVLDETWQLFKTAEYYLKDYSLTDLLNNLEGLRRAYRRKKLEASAEGEEVTLFGVPVDMDRAVELISIQDPPGLANQVLIARNTLKENGLTAGQFKISRNKVQVNGSALQSIVDRHSIYAETLDEKEFLEKMYRMVETIEDVDRFLRKKTELTLLHKPLYPVRLLEWFDHDPKTGYKIKPLRFKGVCKSLKGE